MAYFTDPMSDEFRKAIEEAFREMGNGKTKKGKNANKKHTALKNSSDLKMKRLSKKTKESLR